MENFPITLKTANVAKNQSSATSTTNTHSAPSSQTQQKSNSAISSPCNMVMLRPLLENVTAALLAQNLETFGFIEKVTLLANSAAASGPFNSNASANKPSRFAVVVFKTVASATKAVKNFDYKALQETQIMIGYCSYQVAEKLKLTSHYIKQDPPPSASQEDSPTPPAMLSRTLSSPTGTPSAVTSTTANIQTSPSAVALKKAEKYIQRDSQPDVTKEANRKRKLAGEAHTSSLVALDSPVNKRPSLIGDTKASCEIEKAPAYEERVQLKAVTNDDAATSPAKPSNESILEKHVILPKAPGISVGSQTAMLPIPPVLQEAASQTEPQHPNRLKTMLQHVVDLESQLALVKVQLQQWLSQE